MKHFLSLAFCLGISYLCAQNPSVASLQQTIDDVAEDNAFTHGRLGVSVVEVETNTTIAFKEQNKSMIPASTLKLITTATALQRLGGDFRFETELGYAGPVEDSVLKGDLIITGGGDPCLGSDRFKEYKGFLDKWLQAVQKHGITKIEGDLVADDRFFTGTPIPPGWSWEDMGNYYGAGVFGLNVYDNTYHIVFESGPNPGDKTKILYTEPEVPGLHFTNEVTSGAKNGDYAYVYNAPYSNEVYVRGTITRGQAAFKRTKGAVPNPPLFVAQLLKAKLAEANIAITGKVKVVEESYIRPYVVIHSTFSPTLSEIVAETNAESVNLYAETLLLTAFKAEDDDIYALSAADKLTEYWQQRGVDTEGLSLYDGSGLTRKNSITPKQMALIAAKSYKTDSSFVQYLPCAGQEGTVKYMCKGTAADGAVWMKSGTLDRVRNYAGLAKTSNGKWVSFAIFANDFTGSSSHIRSKIELIITQIASLSL